MNKKILIVLFIFLVILAIIFGMKSCNPRQKAITSDTQEYSAFINANVEYVCALIKDPSLATNNEESQKKLNEMFAKYYLPASDDKEMITLLQKYSDNTEVTAIIQQNTANCQQGGSPIFYQAATN